MTTSTPVDPSCIQEGLDKLWATKDVNKTVKASLFNIIFFTHNSPRQQYIEKIAYKLIEKFPARIFFITSDPAAKESSLKTAVSVISTEQGEYSITCDLIEIAAQGEAEKQVPYLLLPHIISDLPVYLVWSEDPDCKEVFCDQLKSFTTRMIFDSECTEDLCHFAKSVIELEKEFNLEIADLNWGRLESWRDLLSATFSDPDKVEELKRASKMTITYNTMQTPLFCHTKIQSIYLQSWIASRLKWTPDKKRSALDLTRFYYESHGHNIEVQLVGVQKDNLPAGMVVSLEIATRNDEHFVFSRDEKQTHKVSLSYSTKSECQLPTQFLISKEGSGQSLVKEICHKGTSEHYKNVLEMIAHWQRSASC